MDKVGLKNLISEVSNAICGTQIVLEKMKMENFFSYFEPKGDEVISPISKRIELPYNECGKEKKTEIQVPIVSLMSHNPIVLESVEVKIKADLCSYDNELMVSLGNNSNVNDNIQEQDDVKNSECEVTLVFQNKEAVDGLRETIGRINKCI